MNEQSQTEAFSRILADALQLDQSLQRWPSYFRRRYLEFLSYYELLPVRHFQSVLEIGCGNGFQTALLASISNSVTATDLESSSMETHSPGLEVARSVLRKLNVSNAKVLPADATQLPFENESFDLVYSSHMLEHVPDRKKAVAEMYRVLRKGGLLLCVVPTRTDKVYAFPWHYASLVKSAFGKLSRLFSGNNKTSSDTGSQYKGESTKKLSPWLPYPHGAEESYFVELKNWTPLFWRKQLEYSGAELVLQQGTQINPLLPLVGIVSPGFATGIHAVTRKQERYFGKIKLLSALSINTVLIFRKLQ